MKRLDPKQQLKYLKLKCSLLSPLIYRDQALYLQVVRKLLPTTVRKVVFNIIAEQDIDIFTDISLEQRESLKTKLQELVTNCSSLLTVEYLLDLSREIDEEDRLNKELSLRTGQSLEKISEDTDRDFYMSPSEAIEYGIIDNILNKKPVSII